MTSRKPLGAEDHIGRIKANLATVKSTPHNSPWINTLSEDIETLLSMLTQAKIEANILSRVIDVMGYSGDYQLIPERLASILTPPPDAEVREAVEELRLHHKAARDGGLTHSPMALSRKTCRTILRAVQSPRLTGEQVEALEVAADRLDHDSKKLRREASPVAAQLRAAFGLGEV